MDWISLGESSAVTRSFVQLCKWTLRLHQPFNWCSLVIFITMIFAVAELHFIVILVEGNWFGLVAMQNKKWSNLVALRLLEGELKFRYEKEWTILFSSSRPSPSQSLPMSCGECLPQGRWSLGMVDQSGSEMVSYGGWYLIDGQILTELELCGEVYHLGEYLPSG